VSEGWEGWDEYAPFYDWENARTLGRRDLPFWRRFAAAAKGPVLELGCGTGRVTAPLARAGVDIVGIDRSSAMLRRAMAASRSARRSASGAKPASRSISASIPFVRGDIRTLPFRNAAFSTVLAPYGILQSLITSRDLTSALASVARVLQRGGTFGIDLVPDVATWREYSNQRRFRGRINGAALTLFESVRRDPRRRLTVFEERFVVGGGRRAHEHRFSLIFRTLTMAEMKGRLRRAGFAIDATLGNYRGGRWRADADMWIILAKKV
jgi:SAM-dependent methyltransferase